MNPVREIPNRVVVRVTPPTDGVAVRLTFKMGLKNDFHYPVFVDRAGMAELSREQLLAWFDAERNLFLMDFADPRRHFAGEISALVLDLADLKGAAEAFQEFRKTIQFPPNYGEQLKAALTRGQNPQDYKVEVQEKEM